MGDAVHERRFNPERRTARRRDSDSPTSTSTSLPPQVRQGGPTSLATDRLWTVHQAAAFLGRSTSWVYKAAESGSLPRAKGMAGGLRFLPADLMAYARGELPAAVPMRRRART
jgi:predicted DNA-binding transcriptional regulator AlpA